MPINRVIQLFPSTSKADSTSLYLTNYAKRLRVLFFAVFFINFLDDASWGHSYDHIFRDILQR